MNKMTLQKICSIFSIFSFLHLACSTTAPPPSEMTLTIDQGRTFNPNGYTEDASPSSSVDFDQGVESFQDDFNALSQEGVSTQCSPTSEECDALDNDCDGLVDERLGCPCQGEGTCYGGPEISRGIGLCRDGLRACDSTGETWGMCQDWVGPQPEQCFGGEDEDCDGQVDEDNCVDVCSAGETRSCYTGPDGSAETGICRGGKQVCQGGQQWGPCEGEVLPIAEICDDGIDNDCDGLLDTDCYDDLPDVVDEREVGVDIESRPVDFIMAVDNSGSMSDTVALIEQNLVDFTNRLLTSGVDFHLTMVARQGNRSTSVCIPQPLAGPDCTDGPRFLHLDESISSTSAYKDLIDCYDDCGDGRGFNSVLREGSLRQVIVVSDDNARMRWNEFRNEFQARIGDFILHGVIGTRDDDCVAEVGERYLEGIAETQGESLHICDEDWGQVIDVLLEATLERLQVRFSLSQEPILATLQVFVQTEMGEMQLDPMNWNYLPAENAIELVGIEFPASTILVIRYKTNP